MLWVIGLCKLAPFWGPSGDVEIEWGHGEGWGVCPGSLREIGEDAAAVPENGFLDESLVVEESV